MKRKFAESLVFCLLVLLSTSCGRKAALEEGKYIYQKNIDDGQEVASIQVEKNKAHYVLKLKKERRMGDVVLREFSDSQVIISYKTDLKKTITVCENKSRSSYMHQFLIQNDSIRWRYALQKDENGNEVKEKISSKTYISLNKE